MPLPLISKLLPSQPVFGRRQKLLRIKTLRESDAKIQAARQARLARAGGNTARPRPHAAVPSAAVRTPSPAKVATATRPVAAAHATPAPAPVQHVAQAAIPAPAPVAAPVAPQESAIAKAIQGRGTYANAFTARRVQQQQFSRS